MAEESKLQKIVVKNAIEPIPSWKDLCDKDPNEFIAEIAKRLALSYNIDFSSVVISDKIPVQADRGKTWIKTSWPYAIGHVIEGHYQMDYGLSGFQPFTPFQIIKPELILRAYVRKLTEVEIKDYGLYYVSKDKAENRLDWYVFEPPEIKF